MTPDTPLPTTKKRRISAVDCAVGALAIASLAAPFAARLQVQAHAAAPQVAVLGEVSPVRPIDYAMGYAEERAEAAFFEGLEQPSSLDADAALDVALALPASDRAANVDVPDVAAPETKPDIVFRHDLKIARFIQPRPARSIAVVAPPMIADTDFVPDTSDAPPSEDTEVMADVAPEEPEALAEDIEEAVAEIMSAPPRATPIPKIRKRKEKAIQVVSLQRESDTEFALPGDDKLPSAPESGAMIEEGELPPLDITEEPAFDQPTLAMVEPVDIKELPLEVTPKVVTGPAPAVTRSEPATPARDVPKITNGPRIALVIAAAGLNQNVTRFAIEALPAGVTLAFAPVKAQARTLAQEAKDDGHTVLVEIPMEPLNQSRDPGPLTLRVGNSPAQNLSSLDKALALIPSADGASSYLGARFNADERAAAPVIASLAKRGLFFFENEPTSRSVFQSLAARNNLPYARGVLKIDRDRSGAGIRGELDRLERQARQRGYAVGVGTSLRGTISTVALWAKEAEKRGVRLVSITEIGGN